MPQPVALDWAGEPYRSHLLSHPNASIVEQFYEEPSIVFRLIVALVMMVATLAVMYCILRSLCCALCLPFRFLRWFFCCWRRAPRKSVAAPARAKKPRLVAPPSADARRQLRALDLAGALKEAN